MKSEIASTGVTSNTIAATKEQAQAEEHRARVGAWERQQRASALWREQEALANARAASDACGAVEQRLHDARQRLEGLRERGRVEGDVLRAYVRRDRERRPVPDTLSA